MSSPPTTQALLSLAARGIDRRDAEILLAHCLGWARGRLLAEPDALPTPPVRAAFLAAVERRARGEPVAYLLGRREFWSLEFTVGPDVLVPRPETELLVERVLARVPAATAAVADLGTGSGAVAIALAHERPGWSVTATDVSEAALRQARINGDRLVEGRVDWRRGDWYDALAGRRFAALVSNPPYIAEGDPVLSGDGLRHEPRGALTPGGDGLSALDTLINGASAHLEPSGWLLLEHGATQAQEVRARLVARGFTSVTSHRDLAGHERVTEGNLAA